MEEFGTKFFVIFLLYKNILNGKHKENTCWILDHFSTVSGLIHW